MLNLLILVFAGGALGAMLREFTMLAIPDPRDGFPLAILCANLLAAFLLGLVTALHKRQAVSDDVHTMVGTGIMGGLSTFSSFVFGVVSLWMASVTNTFVAVAYIGISLGIGYLAVLLGLKIGEWK